MPMGDSITLGVGGGGYRELLGTMLATNVTTAGRWGYSGLLYGGGGTHCGYVCVVPRPLTGEVDWSIAFPP
jgi:hypothetical protein